MNSLRILSQISLIVAALVLTYRPAVASDSVNPCVASAITNASTFTWGTDDEKLSWLKKIKDFVVKKIPIVKKCEVTAAVSGTVTFGEECCEGASKPSKYTEYKGSGTLDIDIDFIGLGGKLNPSFSVPIWWGYSLAGELKGEASLSGGGVLSGAIDVAGKTGDCACLTVTGSASVSPKISATVGGLIAGGVFDNDDPLEPVAGIVFKAEATASVTATLSVAQFQKSFGPKCDTSDDGLKFCWQLPVFEFSVDIELPLLLPDYTYTFSWDIFSSFGVESSGCAP